MMESQSTVDSRHRIRCQTQYTMTLERMVRLGTQTLERTSLKMIHILAAIIVGASSSTMVSAQKSTVLTASPIIPNLSNPHTVIALIVAIIVVPTFLVGLVLLHRRRKHFPIAGRGSNYLLFLSTWCCLASIFCATASLAFPHGWPCSVEIIFHFGVSVPVATIFLLRGWTLVFRLEVMNFLTETRWRQEKKLALQADERARLEVQAEEAGAVVAPNPIEATQNNDATHITVIQTSDGLQVIDEDPVSIPGYWFIVHRRWIEPSFLGPFVVGFGAFVVLAMTLVSIFDPDIYLTRKNFEKEGIDGSATPSNQFQPDTFLNSPVCLSYSIKAFVFEFVLTSTVAPGVLWCGFRIWIDKQRQVKRKKEQEELHKLLHGTEPQQEHKHLGKEGKNCMDLDDSLNVKSEFLCIVQLVIFGISSLYYPVQFFEPAYTFLLLHLAYILIFIFSIVKPLQLSYAVSRRHRELLGKNRSSNSTTVGSVKAGKGGRLDVHNRLPHQRPYYSLAFIMRNPETYPVLLTFLQKEYSAENAMFFTESRLFERAAKSLESLCPEWPSSHDDEFTTASAPNGGGVAAAARGPQASLTRAPAGGHHRNPTATHATGSLKGHKAQSSLLMNDIPAAVIAAEVRTPVKSPTVVIQVQECSTMQLADSSSSELFIITSSSSSGGSSATSSAPPSGDGSGSGGGTGSTPPASLTVGPQDAPRTPERVSLKINPRAPSSVQHSPVSPPARSPDALSSPSQQGRKGGSFLDFPPPSPLSQIVGAQAQSASFAGISLAPTVYEVDFVHLHSEAQRLKHWAKKIQSEYLVRSSMYEVNLPEDLIKLVSSQIAQLESWEPSAREDSGNNQPPTNYPLPPPFPLSTLYKQTSLAVFDLIARDSFRRFILTSAFEDLLSAADDVELARLEKQADLADTGAHMEKVMAELHGTLSHQNISNPNGSGGSPIVQPSRLGISGGRGAGVAGGAPRTTDLSMLPGAVVIAAGGTSRNEQARPKIRIQTSAVHASAAAVDHTPVGNDHSPSPSPNSAGGSGSAHLQQQHVADGGRPRFNSEVRMQSITPEQPIKAFA